MREAVKKVRCAVYTRKSTEDGLDQEFNSLDAQREACCAYVVSQRHEGWILVPDQYDDGGFSGGNMERPGLKRLLAEVAAGRVDVIVIYKIDRLTRSLSDFSRIVDVLDVAGASFVSITQSFNTTTSMGRLTLNMLLSFAQFEREVTGERIRDKIAASKRKGIWMGGPVPLGYDVRERKLVVNEAEAELVRHIMRRYIALDSARELADELERDGYRTKVQQRTSGPHRGGCVFRRGTLFHLIQNRIYRGDIVHKGVAHSGEHPAIVDEQLWDAVQSTLVARGPGTSRHARAEQPSLLTGMLVDGLGRRMTPVHATKGARRYRYYATRPDQLEQGPAWRVPAHDLERIVFERIGTFLTDQSAIHRLVIEAAADAALAGEAIRRSAALAKRLRDAPTTERIDLLAQLILRVTLDEAAVLIEVSAEQLLAAVEVSATELRDPGMLQLSCATVRVRRGHEVRLLIPGAPDQEAPPRQARNEKLVALLAEADAARRLVLSSPGSSFNRIASAAGRCRTRLGRLFALSHLSPAIVVAIMEGRQPAHLSARQLLAGDLPFAWEDQHQVLGFQQNA